MSDILNINNVDISKIVELLKKISIGECSIALAGAHAKKTADQESDIDIYLFTNEICHFDDIKSIINNIANPNYPVYMSREWKNIPWGGSIDFYYNDTPIEISIREISSVKKTIELSLNGDFEIFTAGWTSNGYYSYIILSEIFFIVPLYESNDFITMAKEKVAKYPPLLKKSIQTRLLNRANTWLKNFHYESAINRVDILFTSPIVIHTLMCIIQVIFALNEEYFMGDKRLEEKITSFKYCPEKLKNNLEFLLSSKKDKIYLTKQMKILNEITEEIKVLINSKDEC